MGLRGRLRFSRIVVSLTLTGALVASEGPIECIPELVAHGGGLNACGCHFNRTTGECHCHQPRGCGCPCQPAGCK